MYLVTFIILPLAPEVSKTVFVADAAPFLSLLVGIYHCIKNNFYELGRKINKLNIRESEIKGLMLDSV